MPRPRMRRRVGFEPEITYFKPAGVPKSRLGETIITLEELEAVRLKDVVGIGQKEAAEKMNISQPTFHRLVLQARKKIADAIVNGKAIRIEGGIYEMAVPELKGEPSKMPQKGRGIGFGGPALVCFCPKCGAQINKTKGVPCASQECPKCGSIMIRK